MYLPLDGPAVYGAKSITSTPVELKVDSSVLDKRKMVTIQPIDGDIYFGFSNSVNTSTGTKIFKGQFFPMEATDSLSVYLVSNGTVDTRISEIA